MIVLSGLLHVILLSLLVVTAASAIFTRHLLVSTILLGIFSLLMAIQYLMLGAPDVAITEAAVGAGISTLLLLLALWIVGAKTKQEKKFEFGPFLAIMITVCLLVAAMLQLPDIGVEDSPAQTHIAKNYIANSEKQTGIPNMVTSILASYRSYDTFGETNVIFTAGLAILLLLGGIKKRKGGYGSKKIQ